MHGTKNVNFISRTSLFRGLKEGNWTTAFQTKQLRLLLNHLHADYGGGDSGNIVRFLMILRKSDIATQTVVPALTICY
jgi:hypothetical protein